MGYECDIFKKFFFVYTVFIYNLNSEEYKIIECISTEPQQCKNLYSKILLSPFYQKK